MPGVPGVLPPVGRLVVPEAAGPLPGVPDEATLPLPRVSYLVPPSTKLFLLSFGDGGRLPRASCCP